MRIQFALVLGCLLVMPVLSQAGGDNDHCPRKMAISVERKLLPVLEALAEALKKSDFFDKHYERQFAKLLEARDKASREARIALMDYYVGEHFGEELTSAVAADGEEIRPLVELYQVCDIRPSVSPVPRDRSLPLRRFVLEMLDEGHPRGLGIDKYKY